MATLPDPRTQVLPDGAAFRVSAFSNPDVYKRQCSPYTVARVVTKAARTMETLQPIQT